MSNYIEYNDTVAFHPGYYIKEIVEESGLTQDDFAKRLGTTPKNLSLLVRGEQNLSIDIANKLSRMLGTSVSFWLNLQQAYDEKLAEYLSYEELKNERGIFKSIDYKYFRDNFGLPDLKRKIDEQIKAVREFLSVSSLSVLGQTSLVVSFRSNPSGLTETNVINANVMTQIAVNQVIRTDAPKFDKYKFEKAVSFALTQTKNHESFLPLIKDAFNKAGVVLVVLPNLKGSGISGATKRVDGKIMLMVNDRRHYADSFWFTLFHEIGHIMNGTFGITLNNEAEDEADLYAKNKLIPSDEYNAFIVENKVFNESVIRDFAESIGRDPGIVYGRLQKDNYISYADTRLSSRLRHKYKIIVS